MFFNLFLIIICVEEWLQISVRVIFFFVCVVDVFELELIFKFIFYENFMEQLRKLLVEFVVSIVIQKKIKLRNKEIKMKDIVFLQVKEVFFISIKFFVGQVVWGFGGYIKDCVQFGFVEFSSKFDLLLWSLGFDR